jgi:hypothetical protein
MRGLGKLLVVLFICYAVGNLVSDFIYYTSSANLVLSWAIAATVLFAWLWVTDDMFGDWMKK